MIASRLRVKSPGNSPAPFDACLEAPTASSRAANRFHRLRDRTAPGTGMSFNRR